MGWCEIGSQHWTNRSETVENAKFPLVEWSVVDGSLTLQGDRLVGMWSHFKKFACWRIWFSFSNLKDDF